MKMIKRNKTWSNHPTYEMRMLIQEMKTIRTVTENSQKKIQTPKIQQTTRQNPKTLSFEVTSITRPPQTSPYEETIDRHPHQQIGTWHKTRKLQEHTTPN